MKTREELAAELARLDSRPYHPEDYLEYIPDDKMAMLVIEHRLNALVFELQSNPHVYINGFLALHTYIKTGVLNDDYTGEFIWSANI
jgi:hypothetical protein